MRKLINVVNMEADAENVAGQITGPMNTLVNVIIIIMAVVGVIMLVKAVSELANAIQQQDNTGIFHAGRGIIAALLLISLKLIINLFGYNF